MVVVSVVRVTRRELMLWLSIALLLGYAAGVHRWWP